MRNPILALALIALAGCATPTYVPTTRYYIEPQIDVKPVNTIDKSLGIRPLEPAGPYKQNVIYRTGGFILGEHATIQWAEIPSAVVTRALTDAIVATKRFKDVGNAADLKMPDFILVGELRKFDEDRTVDPWAAKCEVRLELRPTNGTDTGWADTLAIRVPLEQNDTSALPKAMSNAITQIIKKTAETIATIK